MWLCGPLRGLWADVGTAPGDGEDQALIAEDLDSPQDGVPAHMMLLLKLLYGRQGPEVNLPAPAREHSAG
jgi:hypothetical protein